jgi:hypothetical protein
MYLNGKRINSPRMRVRGIKENDGGGELQV